jgi:hypothetical protein
MHLGCDRTRQYNQSTNDYQTVCLPKHLILCLEWINQFPINSHPVNLAHTTAPTMSWNTNGGGYANGNGNGNGTPTERLRRFDFDSSRDTSADERSRSRGPGGYGGFGAQGGSSVQAPSRLNRALANRKSRDEGTWSKSRSRSRPGGLQGHAGSQVEGQSAWYIGYATMQSGC